MKLGSFSLKGLSRPKESKLFLSLTPVLKEKRTQQFTTLSLTFITIAFFGLFAINPTIGTIVDLQKQLDDSRFVNEQLQKKISNLTSLQTQYVQLEPILDPVLAAVPATPAIDTFVGQIHQLAGTSGVQLNRVQTLPVDLSPTTLKKSKYLSFAFTIEGQGDLLSLQKYMANLVSFNRLLTFDAIDFARVGKIDSTFRVVIRGKVYFKPTQ